MNNKKDQKKQLAEAKQMLEESTKLYDKALELAGAFQDLQKKIKAHRQKRDAWEAK